jgi:hypothetical protein
MGFYPNKLTRKLSTWFGRTDTVELGIQRSQHNVRQLANPTQRMIYRNPLLQ